LTDAVEKLADIFGGALAKRARLTGFALPFALARLLWSPLSDRLGFNGCRQPDEPPEVLRYAGHEELVARTAEAAKPHSLEAERGLQMRK
jgi:hypothetical protein